MRRLRSILIPLAAALTLAGASYAAATGAHSASSTSVTPPPPAAFCSTPSEYCSAYNAAKGLPTLQGATTTISSLGATTKFTSIKALLKVLRQSTSGQTYTTIYDHLGTPKPGVIYVLARATKRANGQAVYIEQLLPGQPPRVLIIKIYKDGRTVPYILPTS
jgi:hypothetical protein